MVGNCDKRKRTPRNKWDFVQPGTQPGDVLEWSPLAPDYVTVTALADNPDEFNKGPIEHEVDRILPGVRAALRLSGCPFKFVVRVVRDEQNNPRVVDLRMYSPHYFGDVPITNADLKAVPLARLAAYSLDPEIPGLEIPGLEIVHTDDDPPSDVEREPGRPKMLTDDFLRKVTRLAREARENNRDINRYIAAGMRPTVGRTVGESAVRRWRTEAIARRRKSPEDNSFLRSGELRGKPRKGTGR